MCSVGEVCVFQPDMYSCLPGYPHQKKKNSVSAFATCVQDEKIVRAMYRTVRYTIVKPTVV